MLRPTTLRAALAATLSSISLTFSDSTPSSSSTPSEPQFSQVLLRAKKTLLDTPPSSSSIQSSHSRISPTEEARARAVLNRYYSISAEAQSANLSSRDTPVAESAAKKASPKKKEPRVPPEQVFRDFDLDAVSGPASIKYVICGGGTAAWAAIEAILEVQPRAANDILLVTEESYYPYNRTVLSKELWQGDTKELFRSEVATKNAVEYGYRGAKGTRVSVLRGRRVERLDTDEKAISFADGRTLHYDKLLLATGGTPKGARSVSASLATSDLEGHVNIFRSLDDFTALRQDLEKNDKGIIVIGGGFLGTELAIALASVSEKVTLVFAEAGVLYRVLPRYLCQFLARQLEEIGVTVVRSAVVTNASKKHAADDVVALNLVSPDVDYVEGKKIVVAVGIEPEVGLARDAGLEVDNENGGIRVNDFMMVEPDIFAAGDVASFHDRSLGRRRVEHWDHAVVSGRIAGQNMVGKKSRYGLQSMFWSDLTNIGVSFTAVGLVDSSLDTIAVWNLEDAPMEAAPSSNKYRSGVVYYIKNSEVVGVLLWNPRKGSGALRRARALISAKTRLEELSEKTLADLVSLEEAPFRTTIQTRVGPPPKSK